MTSSLSLFQLGKRVSFAPLKPRSVSELMEGINNILNAIFISYDDLVGFASKYLAGLVVLLAGITKILPLSQHLSHSQLKKRNFGANSLESCF
jgi:hypothetical protein